MRCRLAAKATSAIALQPQCNPARGPRTQVFSENCFKETRRRVQFPPPPLRSKLLTDESLRQQATQAPAPPGLVRFRSLPRLGRRRHAVTGRDPGRRPDCRHRADSLRRPRRAVREGCSRASARSSMPMWVDLAVSQMSACRANSLASMIEAPERTSPVMWLCRPAVSSPASRQGYVQPKGASFTELVSTNRQNIIFMSNKLNEFRDILSGPSPRTARPGSRPGA